MNTFYKFYKFAYQLINLFYLLFHYKHLYKWGQFCYQQYNQPWSWQHLELFEKLTGLPRNILNIGINRKSKDSKKELMEHKHKPAAKVAVSASSFPILFWVGSCFLVMICWTSWELNPFTGPEPIPQLNIPGQLSIHQLFIINYHLHKS